MNRVRAALRCMCRVLLFARRLLCLFGVLVLICRFSRVCRLPFGVVAVVEGCVKRAIRQ